MATNPEVRRELLKRLGNVTPQRLSQLVGEVKKQHGPMSTADAVYVLAHQKGIDLTKYLDRDTVDRVRGMVPRTNGGLAAAAATKQTTAPMAARRASRPVRVTAGVPAVDLLLPTSVVTDATRMTELYPKVYLLENSLRSVINRVLTAKHGKDWWQTKAPSGVRRLVQGRKDKEDKVPWHGKRGAHEIYYSDFSDLRNIIEKNWADFDPIIRKQQWINQWLEELEPARNTLAHNNPVSENEQKRIEVFFNDWAQLIDANRTTIP
jgi:Swt1-like HEPN